MLCGEVLAVAFLLAAYLAAGTDACRSRPSPHWPSVFGPAHGRLVELGHQLLAFAALRCVLQLGPCLLGTAVAHVR